MATANEKAYAFKVVTCMALIGQITLAAFFEKQISPVTSNTFLIWILAVLYAFASWIYSVISIKSQKLEWRIRYFDYGSIMIAASSFVMIVAEKNIDKFGEENHAIAFLISILALVLSYFLFLPKKLGPKIFSEERGTIKFR